MKKAFISADIEGMEGNVSRIQSNRGNMDYSIARKRLAEDVNVAVRACFDSGYDEVYVCDGHGDMENLIIEDMDPRCKLVSGAMRSSLQMKGIDSSFDAYISFGHAGAGLTLGGVIDHCYNGGKIYNLRFNGVTMNTETVCNGFVAGYYGVPLVACIGDKALARCNEIKPIECAETLTMEIDFKDSNMADTASLVPGVVRLAPRTVSFTGDPETVFKVHEPLIFRLVDAWNM